MAKIGKISKGRRLAPLSALSPYEKNPRKIPEEAVRVVAGSIAKYGFRQPIIVDANGVIVAGHTRYKAAQELGMEEVWVELADDLTPPQIRAFRLVDNRSHEFSGWDIDILADEVTDRMKNDMEDAEELLGFGATEPAHLEVLSHDLDDPDEVETPQPIEDEIGDPENEMATLQFLVPRVHAVALRHEIEELIVNYLEKEAS